MKTEVIRLHFTSGLHIGRGADDLDKTATTYGSDALKSALYAIGLSYYPEWRNEKIFFEGFRISSAFPFCDKDYFLPKPGGMNFQFEKGNDLTEAKMAKKIVYVSHSLLAQWAKKPDYKIIVSGRQVGDNAFLFQSNDARKFLHTSIQQRVSVGVEDVETRPYYFERLFFEEGSGLYFLMQFTNEELRLQVLHALRILGDAGIGTDRTVGNGQFKADEPSAFNLPVGNSKGRQMALGLYLPTKEELAATEMNESNWTLIRRGGYMAASDNDSYRSLRKNSIYFFGEGSAFKVRQPLKGRYIDLQPKWNDPGMHPVWRCGMPLFIDL
ncbi:MAG: type III-A CRISPR-associated RAMP protein Csm4 [Bacteroidota bacterium]